MVTCDDPAVQITELTHRYGRRVALDAFSLSVERASLFALLGPNGSGKTTLFRILATVLTPSSGSVRIAGLDLARQRANARRRIGVVFQEPSIDNRLTVAENLMHQGHLYGLRGAVLRQRSTELLHRFGLSQRSRDRVGVLSGGLRRRVELAKALLHRPEVLILDEPSTGLDPGARYDLLSHLEELRDQDGVTCLLTTHLTEEADRCDRVGIVDQGKAVAVDSPHALKATIGGDILWVRTENPTQFASMLAERFGITADTADDGVRIERQSGHRFVPELIEACPGTIRSVTVGKPTLEDVFLHKTGHGLWNGTARDRNKT